VSEAESFFDKTEKDDLGGGIIHERTPKAIEAYKEVIAQLQPYRLWKNVRNPTDIIIATDGFCFSTCAYFVNDAIKAGAAIVAGFGLTNPGGDLFAAGQCPSCVIPPEYFFDEVKNNSVYGLDFRSTCAESYSISDKDNVIPGDYIIIPVDVHTGFYESYNPSNSKDILSLLNKTLEVRNNFRTKCNPANPRLLLVTDQCTSTKPFAVRSGYACGSNGEWNTTTCKIAFCSDGYVVDFDNDRCVPNHCDPRYVPPVRSSSSSTPNSFASSSTTLHPLMAITLSSFITFIHFIY